jgi:hypothetical protein
LDPEERAASNARARARIRGRAPAHRRPPRDGRFTADVGPTKFPKKCSDSYAAYKERDWGWHFGYWEGPYVFIGGDPGVGGLGSDYEDAVGLGQAIFNGGQDFFRLARWELWQIA